LQEELLAARRQIDLQSNQILSLETALASRPILPSDATPPEKDRLLEEQRDTIEDLRRALRGHEANLGEPLRKVREDVEAEYSVRLKHLENHQKEKDAWVDELIKQIEREKQVRIVFFAKVMYRRFTHVLVAH
jgi:centromeric protein E